MKNRLEIKEIEDLSLNAWPSHQMQLYDGWILRFSYFYTHRTNCVEQIGPSSLPLPEKIAYCESIYRRWGTPAIFKISPLLVPSFDRILEEKGYTIEHVNHVMCQNFLTGSSASPDADDVRSTASLLPAASDTPQPLSQAVKPGNSEDTEKWPLPYPRRLLESYPEEQGFSIRVSPDPLRPTITLECSSFIPSNWIEGLFSLKKTTNAMHRQVVPSMYRAIPKDTICVSLRDGNRFIGTGLGILDREYLGIYAIHVHPDYRRRHYGRTIVSTLLEKGRMLGAEKSYLQVVDGNLAAERLYRSLGFSYAYTCWFRVKQLR